jgi:hypothetical protein
MFFAKVLLCYQLVPITQKFLIQVCESQNKTFNWELKFKRQFSFFLGKFLSNINGNKFLKN